MISMVCYLKACQPNCLKVVNGKLNSSDIIKAASLDKIDASESINHLPYVSTLVRFDLANEITRKANVGRRENEWNT